MMMIVSSEQRKARWTGCHWTRSHTSRTGRNGVSRCEDEEDENVVEVREDGIRVGLKSLKYGPGLSDTLKITGLIKWSISPMILEIGPEEVRSSFKNFSCALVNTRRSAALSTVARS